MFENVLAPGGSLVCIASIAGYMLGADLPSEVENHLAWSSLEKLLEHEYVKLGIEDPGYAYGLSKRANQLRVQAAARAYGKRGCRINSISPGVIRSTMLKQEIEAPRGRSMKILVERSPAQRFGTPGDIANAVAFLISPDASFITGTDLLVDGGSTAVQRWGECNDTSLQDLA
jgi:NAD(P)-dependent dehydrogenase (short-subunit alcohol dehydrogenase family)